MMIIVGLGNPETKYKNTPHNIGFEAIDRIAKENNFPDFKLSKKFKAIISEKDDTILVKPETYMNNSGQSVAKLVKFYKTKDLTVIHDDIDLPLGKIRVSQNRGSAGHKGIESIIKELGTKDFKRIRIGIQPEKKIINIERYVLTKFTKEAKQLIIESIKKTLEEI